jgi:hypothetical protein
MIENIKEFRSELQPESFTERDVLKNSHVPVNQIKATEQLPTESRMRGSRRLKSPQVR